MTITAGLGFTVDHLAEALTARSEGLWFEVHSEAFMVENGPRLAALQALAERYPISLHGAGLSLVSSAPPRREALERLRWLSERVMPIAISDHLGWQKWGGVQYADYLPFSRTLEVLKAAADNIMRVQDALGRRIMVENPASYIRLPGHAFEEAEFLVELCARTGCGLLVDITNIYVSARNLGTSADAYIDGLPAKLIGEIHLGGTSTSPDPTCPVLVDSHDVPIPHAVWRLFLRLIDRIGPRPTLIEHEGDGTSFAALLAERNAAHGMLDEAERVHA